MSQLGSNNFYVVDIIFSFWIFSNRCLVPSFCFNTKTASAVLLKLGNEQKHYQEGRSHVFF